MLERRRAGQGACGWRPSHCLGRRIDRQKKYNIKYTFDFNLRKLPIETSTKILVDNYIEVLLDSASDMHLSLWNSFLLEFIPNNLINKKLWVYGYNNDKTGILLIDKNGNYDDLNLNLVESPQTTLLKFGMHYDGLFKSALLVNLTQKKLISKNDVAFLDVCLGDNFRYNLEYYIDNGFHWSFGIKSKFMGQLAIAFETKIRYTFNDDLDYTSPTIPRLNIGGTNNDWYVFSGVSLLYTFGRPACYTNGL
mgnify:CR=1 FL=1